MTDSTYIGFVAATAPSADTFEAIVHELETQGFDRAQFSVITPDTKGDALETADDRQQIRVLGTSLGATAAGLAGAGLAAVATSGMALPAIVAGVGAAGGVAALSEAVGIRHERSVADWMTEQAEAGGIVVHIGLTDESQRALALATARKYCGSAAFCDKSGPPAARAA